MKISLGHYNNLLDAGMTAEELLLIGITPNNQFCVPRVRPSWHQYWLAIAELISQRSHDAQTQHGCVLVKNNALLAAGYNGFPPGAPDNLLPNIRENGYKYFAIEHAEVSCILDAARRGISLDSAIAYITGAPCHSCARRLVSCGIKQWYIGSRTHVSSEQERIWNKLWQTIYNVDVIKLECKENS